jgi:hypothetical protein
LFDSTRANPEYVAVPRKASLISAHTPTHALKKLTKKAASEVSFTVPSSNSESLYASTTSNIWTRLLGGNDELWDKVICRMTTATMQQSRHVHDSAFSRPVTFLLHW